MFKVKSSIGHFYIDKKGNFIKLEPHSSDDEALEELLTDLGQLNPGYDIFLRDQEKLVSVAGLGMSEYREMRHRIAIALARRMLSRSLGEQDAIIQSIETLGDVNKALNILASRLTAIYSAMGMKLELGGEDIDYRSIIEAGERVLDDSVKRYSVQVENLVGYKEALELDIEGLMMNIAPNIAGLCGPLLGAKIIRAAGGLDRLARMPGSRIQVMGAEKSMFRHIRERGKPPKHGLIFQHPTISKSPWWQRGKIARALANKIAIAARLDAYYGEDRSEELKNSFMKRYEAVRTTHVKEPKKLRIIRTPKTKKKRRRK